MEVNLNSWMNDIDSNKDLFSLDIPGSHDCVTKYVQFAHISKCQDMNIYEQLSIGIRALDIRVKSKGDRLGMVHGAAKAFNTANHFSSQMDFSDVLEQCYRFLNENPSETIIIQFKNDSNKEMEVCFDNLYYRYIKNNEDKWYLENRVPTLGEARGKIVLIRRCKMDLNNKEFTDENTGIDFSRWVEQDTAEPYPLTLETYSKGSAIFVIQDRFKYKPEPRWNKCVKPFLDLRSEFDGTYIICYLSTAGGIKGPKNNSKYINPHFMAYEMNKNKYYGTIYLDFPTPELTSKIISNNLT
jgi:1-phosphatidylinositol phosphodiesterase